MRVRPNTKSDSTVVAFWSLTQEVARSSPFTVMSNIFVTEFSEFSGTLRKNSIDRFKLEMKIRQ